VANVHVPAGWKVKRASLGAVRIGELAQAVALPTKTIRYYEEIGLLPEPDRRPNGYRAYDDSACERLRFVKAAQAVGFSLGEIKEIVAFRDRGEQPCAHVLDLVDRRERDIADRIAALERMQGDLRRLSSRARSVPRHSGSYCHLIEQAGR
jgi:MerR family transcriptional regulator, copper efflux regulator